MVIVKLNLSLIKLVNKKKLELNIQGPKTLNEVLNEIGLSQNDIGMVLKNGRWAPLDCLIEENDTVQLFPHLEGG
ncbi:MAG: MoaD/ThiS family protein [Sedimentibacter sp.]